MASKLSIKVKILLMITFLSTLTLFIGISGVQALRHVSENYNRIADVNLNNVISLEEMKGETHEALRLFLNLTVQGNGKEEDGRLFKKYEDSVNRFSKWAKDLEAAPLSPEDREDLRHLVEIKTDVNQTISQNLNLARSPLAADREAFGVLYRGPFKDRRLELYKYIDKLVGAQRNEVKTTVAETADEVRSEIRLTVAIIGVGFLVSFFVGFLFARSLNGQLVRVSAKLSEGSTKVRAASVEIAQASDDLSSCTTEQAASVQETSASVEQLSAMVSRNSDNAEKSKDRAESSQQVACTGQDLVVEMLNAIREIDQSNTQIMQAVEESNRNISEITGVITEIGNKTKIINDIVFQTKLLSFNASVEAARAGEYGKGFAVVAEEIGNLAASSGTAAQEISKMLEASISRANSLAESTKDKVNGLVRNGKDKVDKGQLTASECEKILKQIVGQASEVSSMVLEITAASKEQSQGIHEITKAMGQIDSTTQQNASASQAAALTSTRLAHEAEELEVLVGELEKVIHGAA